MKLKTGFENLDNAMGGLNESNLIVIASRPGMGKSTLAINIINNVANQVKDKVLYFNFETTKERLKEKIKSDNIEIVDKPNIPIEEIKNKSEEVSKNGLSLIVIDYIQLVKPTTLDTSVFDSLKHSVDVLKEIATSLNVPIIILYQLSREQAEKIDDDYPTNIDYQNISPFLLNADKIILLYREDSYKFNKNVEDNNKDYFKDTKILDDKTILAIME